MSVRMNQLYNMIRLECNYGYLLHQGSCFKQNHVLREACKETPGGKRINNIGSLVIILEKYREEREKLVVLSSVNNNKALMQINSQQQNKQTTANRNKEKLQVSSAPFQFKWVREVTQAAGNWQQHKGNCQEAGATQVTSSRAPWAATALPGPALPWAFPHSRLIATPCSFHSSFQCLPSDEEPKVYEVWPTCPHAQIGKDWIQLPGPESASPACAHVVTSSSIGMVVPHTTQ